VLVAVNLTRGNVLVEGAEQATVLGLQDPPALREGLGGVVDLDPAGGPADATIVSRPSAHPLVPLPDLAADGGGDVAGAGLGGRGCRRRRRGPLTRSLLPRVLHEPAALGGTFEEEIEPGLDDLVAAGAGVRVGEGVAGGVELLEEALRDRDVEAAEFGRERFDLEYRRLRGRRDGRHIWDAGVGMRMVRRRTTRRGEFTRSRKRRTRHRGGGRGSRRLDEGDDVAERWRLRGKELRGDLLRLALRT